MGQVGWKEKAGRFSTLAKTLSHFSLKFVAAIKLINVV